MQGASWTREYTSWRLFHVQAAEEILQDNANGMQSFKAHWDVLLTLGQLTSL